MYALSDKNDSSLFPVLVFVHGEDYETGSGNAYEGSILSAFGRIVVVTLNYRLGILGLSGYSYVYGVFPQTGIPVISPVLEMNASTSGG